MQKERTGGGVLPWLRSESSQRGDAKPLSLDESKRNLRMIVGERVARAKDLPPPRRALVNSSRQGEFKMTDEQMLKQSGSYLVLKSS